MNITKQEFDSIVVSKEVREVFDLADNMSASLADKLLAAGIGDRATARPFAMKWASAKYGVRVVMGQRGLTWAARNTAAEKAVNRVLATCFPSVDLPTSNSRKPAPVKFSRAQQSAAKLFLAEFEGKTLAEQIKQARALLQQLAD